METFIEALAMVDNPDYSVQRLRALAKLDINDIDAPIADLIIRLNRQPYCFTLQCCYGHFVKTSLEHAHELCELPGLTDTTVVEYRIAYIAFCIENSPAGRTFLGELTLLTTIDPACVQFGCAEWFWKQQANSYILQVEPHSHKDKDRVRLGIREAECVETVRNRFFARLDKTLEHSPGS
jgi:hypothetical protein